MEVVVDERQGVDEKGPVSKPREGVWSGLIKTSRRRYPGEDGFLSPSSDSSDPRVRCQRHDTMNLWS